jgi:hypothetical protein
VKSHELQVQFVGLKSLGVGGPVIYFLGFLFFGFFYIFWVFLLRHVSSPHRPARM